MKHSEFEQTEQSNRGNHSKTGQFRSFEAVGLSRRSCVLPRATHPGDPSQAVPKEARHAKVMRHIFTGVAKHAGVKQSAWCQLGVTSLRLRYLGFRDACFGTMACRQSMLPECGTEYYDIHAPAAAGIGVYVMHQYGT